MSVRESGAALLTRLLSLPRDKRAEVLRALSAPQVRELNTRWWAWAHAGQAWPEGDWALWLIRAGRGFGKTRAGAEWVSQVARDNPGALIALVGATEADARRVMIEGPAGIMSVVRPEESAVWLPSAGEVHFESGARAFVFSAETPEKLRGPQHMAAWCDEVGKWRKGRGEAAWDNLTLGMREGEHPRVLVTTTPRSTTLMRRLRAMPNLVETLGRTHDNPHLPASYVAAMLAEYGGTRLGRQELEGEIIEEVDGALWSRKLIEQQRVRKAPKLVRVVIGVDPPAGSIRPGGGDACGIVAVALGADGLGYVVEDASVQALGPEGWTRAVAACAARWKADRVIAERNQGGSMVESVLRAADSDLPIRLVHASRGKTARAEPIAMLYERGKVCHVGAFPELEDELCGLQTGGGYEGPGRSPDRADALVWALTELLMRRKRAARVRRL